MYKEIRIETSYSSMMVEQSLKSSKEITLAYMEGDKKAVLIDDSEKSKKLDKNLFLPIWNEIIKLNLTKVLLENSNICGFDGYELTIHIGMGMSNATVTLWCPDEAEYERTGCTESAALMKCVNEILKIGAENGVRMVFE